MASQEYIKLGYWNFYCQICGDKVKMPGGATKDFRGLWVCPDCLDIQNPQEKPTYRPSKPRAIYPANTTLIARNPGSGTYIVNGHYMFTSGGVEMVVDPTISYGRIGHDGDTTTIPTGKVDHDTT